MSRMSEQIAYRCGIIYPIFPVSGHGWKCMYVIMIFVTLSPSIKDLSTVNQDQDMKSLFQLF